MQDKKTLIVIIILIVVCLPSGIYGMYIHYNGGSVKNVDDNPNKELIYNNNVYFYDSGSLVGTYPCSNCSVVVTSIDDDAYNINYYKNGTKKLANVYGGIIGLVKEGNKIDLIAIKTKKVTATFDAIKTYNVGHTKDIFLVKKDNKYAIYSVSNYILPITDYIYDFLAIPNRLKDGLLDTSKIIAKDGDSWNVLEYDEKNNKYVPNNVVYNPIVDLNDNYFATLKDSKYELYDYSGKKVLDTVTNISKKVVFCDEYVGIVLNDSILIYKDVDKGIVKSIKIPSNYNDIDIDLDNNEVIVLIDGNRLDIS